MTDIEAEIVSGAPVIVHEGVYRLYEKPDGTLRIQYRRNGKEEDDFFELPGAMVALAKAASEGKLSPAQMMVKAAQFMGGFGNGRKSA